MRVTESYKYFNYHSNQQNVASKLNKTINQINSGLKIEFGNEDPTAFINTLRLDQEINTLNQSTANMHSAQKFANHTDTALNEMTKSLEQFKTKLIYAANDSHSTTSYGALAVELEAIRDHIINLANTNINGEYLFSGSATSVRPVSADGTYNGNDLKMETITGSNITSAYNITGADLFLGQNEDYSKKITTNVSLYNQTKLHPGVMQAGEADDVTSKKEHISPQDSIRDLVGDNDDDPTNDGNYHFYVSGVKSYGESFQEKISMPTDNSVDALLTRIGEAYGNTSTNRVVDVSLNQGRIEIEDLQNGSSKLDFHMFGSTQDNDDIDALVSSGADIKEFVRSPQRLAPTIEQISASQDKYNPSLHTINSSLRTDDGAAKSLTNLSDIFPGTVESIALTGSDTNGDPVDEVLNIDGNTKVSDLMSEISDRYGDVNVSINRHGRLEIEDRSAGGNLNVTLQTQDDGGDGVAGFGNDMASMQAAGFEVKDAVLKSNVPQVISSSNAFATDKTKLSEVASGGSVAGSSFDLDFTNVNGVEQKARIDFSGADVVVQIDTNSVGVYDDSFTVINPDGSDTAADDMTYRQLNDAIGMLVSGNIPDSTLAGDDYKENYREQLKNADARVDTFIDENGKMTIKDRAVTDTPIRFAMYDSNAKDFGSDAAQMSFSANNALVVDDVHVDMFSMLNSAIEAVENGFSRPDSENPDLSRNVGIQNLLQQLDHVHDHTIRKHTQIGAVSQSFNYQISRNETLEVHTKALRSEIIDVDFAEAAMNLQQLQLNYQAMASSISKVQGLSLVNYL